MYMEEISKGLRTGEWASTREVDVTSLLRTCRDDMRGWLDEYVVSCVRRGGRGRGGMR